MRYVLCEKNLKKIFFWWSYWRVLQNIQIYYIVETISQKKWKRLILKILSFSINELFLIYHFHINKSFSIYLQFISIIFIINLSI